MESLILWGIFGGAAALLVYPFVIYPVILALLPRAPAPRPGPPPRRFALLFSARNEAADLPETLQSLAALKRQWPELQILAWNDASSDETGRLLDRASGILTVRHASRSLGKTVALRRLIEGVEADVLLMMDANIRFRADKVLHFRDAFADESVGAVGARLLPAASGARSGVGRLYWWLEERIKRLETATGSTIGCDGALWGIRRHLYPAFGVEAADDFRPSMEALLQGYRVISDPRIVVRETAVPDAFAARRAMRIGCGAWHGHRQVWARVRERGGLDLFKYVSHKLMRWFSGVWLVLAVLSGLALAARAGLLAEAGLLSGVAMAAALVGVPPFPGLWRIATTFLATTAGVMRAARGRSATVWAPVRLR
ncbi:glycosyltransferase [Oceanibium sediminis]|uniref:glycosyltransferase n=1 Tax=Oceanibium sediminis TaxID=2026339 RepID=UPI0013001AB0|nr:glycosyltransferase [Oceanibium sediminis]